MSASIASAPALKSVGSHSVSCDYGPKITKEECYYIARKVLRDERCAGSLDALRADGFSPLEETDLENGGKYLIALGTLYCGQTVPQYGEPKRVTARLDGSRFVFLPHGARTRYFVPAGPSLVKHA